MKKILLLCVVVVAITACRTVQPDLSVRYDKRVVGNIIHLPIVAELDVLDKVRETFIYDHYNNISTEMVRQMAITDLLEKYQADVVIEPVISFDVMGGRQVTVNISCYIGKYKNFRQMVLADTVMTKFSIIAVQ